MPHILVVCTANICRSPVAEALLRDRLKKRGLDNWTVSSAGTWAYLERGAAQYSIDLMAEQGFDLSKHRARMVNLDHLEEADLILCMETGHVEALQAEFPEHSAKIVLINELVGRSHSVLDPYGGPIEAYRRMVAELTEIIDSGLDRVVKMVQQSDDDEGDGSAG